MTGFVWCAGCGHPSTDQHLRRGRRGHTDRPGGQPQVCRCKRLAYGSRRAPAPQIVRCVMCGRVGARQFVRVATDSVLAAIGTHVCADKALCRDRIRTAISHWEVTVRRNHLEASDAARCEEFFRSLEKKGQTA